MFAAALAALGGCQSATPGFCDAGAPAGPGCQAANPVIVQVSPTSAVIAIGQTVQLTDAVAVDVGSGSPVVLWSSSDSLAASVDSTGKVTGRRVTLGIAVCATIREDTAAGSSCATITVLPGNANIPSAARRQR
jgi:uncharacterized protein YjdB